MSDDAHHGSDERCPHCGAAREEGPTCPVCELKYDTHKYARSSTVLGRAWQSGRLALGVAATLWFSALWAPFATMRSTLVADAPAIPVTLADMILQSGPLAREVRSLTVIAVPFAAIMTVQFLFTRTSGGTMRASRPMLFVMAALPLASMITGLRRLERATRYETALSLAPWLVALGSIAALVGALRFGNGVPERSPSAAARGRRAHDEGEDR